MFIETQAQQDLPVSSRPDFLEGMRGLAAWMVVCGHTLNAFIPELTGATSEVSLVKGLSRTEQIFVYTPLSIFDKAHFAVLFFFVHSGFVLSFKFFTRTQDPSLITDAAVRRYPRLAIPALASILIAYIIAGFGGFSAGEVAHLTKSSWLLPHFGFAPDLLEALKQGLFTQYFRDTIPLDQNYNSSLWTINLEIMGSVVVFAFLAIFGTYRRREPVYIALAIIFWSSPLLAFIAGIALCDLYSRRMVFALGKPLSYTCLLLGLYLGCYSTGAEEFSVYRPVKSLVTHGFGEQMVTLGALLVVVSALATKGFEGFFAKRSFKFLGEISYSVYLLHLLIICSAGCKTYLTARRSGATHEEATITAASVIFFVTFLGAWLFRNYVDKPAIAVSKKLADLGRHPFRKIYH